MPRAELLIVAIGLVGGVTSGLLGVGGGVVMVPGLVALASVARKRAHAASLGAILPIAIVGVTVYAARNEIDYGLFWFLAAGSVIGAPIGVRLLTRVPELVSVVIFDAIVIAAALRLLIPSTPAAAGSAAIGTLDAILAVLVGLVAGALAGLLGVGGGALMVPAMVVLLGRTQHVAAGTSLAVIIPTAIAGSIANAREGLLGVRETLVLSAGGIVGAVGGSLLALEVDESALRKIFGVFLLILAGSSVMGWGKERPKTPVG